MCRAFGADWNVLTMFPALTGGAINSRRFAAGPQSRLFRESRVEYNERYLLVRCFAHF